ncbi:glycosyltransferase [Staphylococcus sp. 17KM0847]|uniref:glycosyltransferase n=1 Tax=Staphylococcus sp. 17KM0847 TaxID=2583989 RepID=UPI0015DC1A3F|nr:glycosyltransferase [Staphylococcus sp. 17KM0847]QLK86825.1 glycosyltransferase [Staphylococcus sp. 17KM0847]
MKNVIFITSRLDEKHGGLTASLLNKVRILNENKNLISTILTFHAASEFNQVKSTIMQRYNLYKKVKIYNINEFFRSRCLTAPEKKYDINTEIYTPVKVNDTKYEYYHLGVKVLEIFYRNRQIKEVRHFNQSNVCFQKDVIDNDGYLYWRSYYLNSQLSRQIFFRRDLTPFLTREFDAINKSDKIKSLVLFEKETIRFNTFNDFKAYFINFFIEKPITYLVGEARSIDPVILNIKDECIRKIFMTHSIHIRPGTDIIRAGNRHVLSHLNDIDALVLLTNKQKEDIDRRFGVRSNYYVIPHSIKIPTITEKREQNKVVIISRLHKEKRIDHSIKAFAQVINKIPDAKLHIYGEGEEKENLQKLINKMGLQNNIKLKGYSQQVNKILQSADCSLLTSQYEGFALAVQESIANGTPVIAYDIDYGPSDMITDGVNGYLVEKNNIDKLSHSIIKYLKKTTKEKKIYSTAAINKARQFSNEQFSNNWFFLFDSIKKKSPNMNPIITFFNINRSKFNKHKYYLNLQIRLNKEINRVPLFKASFLHKSTLINREKTKIDFIEPHTIRQNNNCFTLKFIFDIRQFKKHETYLTSIIIQDHDQYFDLPITINNYELDTKSLSFKKCKVLINTEHNTLQFEL